MPGRFDEDDDRDEVEKTMPGILALEDIPRIQKPSVLEMIRGPGAPHPFVLNGPRMIIGRTSAADIQVDSAELSRQHVALVQSGAEYRLEDLGSRNGTYLNGLKIHAATLREGDQIQLGDVIFLYHEGR